MSRSRRITACLVAAAMAAMLVPVAPAVAAETGGTADGFTYVLAEDGSATITRFVDNEATVVSVPESVDGHVVKRLFYRAIQADKAVTIALPKTLEAITGEGNATPLSVMFAPNTFLNLESYQVDSGNTHFTAVDGVLYSSDKTVLVAYPAAKKETSFAIPEGVERLGSGSFGGSKLESVSIPASLKELYNNPFYSSYKLATIEVSKDSTVYCAVDNVLLSKDRKTLYAYPNGKTSEEYAIPEGVTSLINEAFYAQPYVRTISLPVSLKQVTGSVLGACPNLKAVKVSGNNQHFTSDDGILFSKDMRKLYVFPAGLEMAQYEVPASVETLNHMAFSGARVSEVVVPATVSSFGTSCLTLNATVVVATQSQYKLLKDDARYVTLNLYGSGTTVVYSPGMVGVIDGGTGKAPVLNKSFKAATEEGKAIFTLIAKYKAAKGTMAAKATKVSYAGEVRVDYYPAGKGGSVSFNTLRYNNQLYKIAAVNKGVLRANKYVAAVALGSNVASVAAGAFQGCKNLRSLYMGTGLKSVGKSAFYKCPRLASVTVASTGLKAGKMGSAAFKGTAKKAVFQVPKSKFKTYKKIFMKAGASAKASFKKA